MRLFFSILLLAIMTANLAASFAEQCQFGKNTFEVFEFGADDTEEESKDSKGKTEKEKESFTYAPRIGLASDASILGNLFVHLFDGNEILISECHASLPEFPPEA